MKINRIQIDNVLGARSIDVHLETPVTLISGKNGAGKSSIKEAILMAITGDVPRVRLKKEYPALVHTGYKAGGVLVEVEGGKHYALNLPKAASQVDPDLPTGDAIGVALNGQRFASMTPDERRAFLYAVTGCKITSAEASKRMLARKLDEAKVAVVAPLVRTGFAAAKDYAADEARKGKGAWQQITGQTWGGVAAEGWKADKPEIIEPEHGNETASKLGHEIDALNKQVGEVQGAQRAQAMAKKRRAELLEQSKSAPNISGNLKRAEQELAEYEPKVEAMRQRARGGRPVGLVHDLAYALDGLVEKSPYKVSGEDDEIYRPALAALDAYETQHGEIKTTGTIDIEAKNSLPEYERGLEVLQNRVKNLKRDFDAATGADQRLAELEAQTDFDADHATGVQELQQRINALRASRAKMIEAIDAAAAAWRQCERADEQTAKATKINADIKAWLAIADACAPDGIPGELLAEALKPVNSALTASAAFSGWAPVYIDQEMAITAGDRAYALLSESEQWRTDAMIAQAVAQITGLRVMMLDRFDVLDLPGRSQAINWLHALAEEGHIETALVFGTLKQLPAVLPPTFTAHWIENGVIEALREAA